MNGMSDQAILVTGAAGFIGFLSRSGFSKRQGRRRPRQSQRLLRSGAEAGAARDARQRSAVSLRKAGSRRSTAHREAVRRRAFPVVIHLAAQAGVRYSLQNPQAYIAANLQGFATCSRDVDTTVPPFAVCVVVVGLWRQHQAAVLRARQCRSSDQPLRSDQEVQRIDGAFLQPSVSASDHGAAVLHRLRALGPARHGDVIFAKAILEGRPIKLFNHGEIGAISPTWMHYRSAGPAHRSSAAARTGVVRRASRPGARAPRHGASTTSATTNRKN